MRWVPFRGFVQGHSFDARTELGELVVGGPERVKLGNVGFCGAESSSEGAEESVISVFELAAWWAIQVEAEKNVVEVGTVAKVGVLNGFKDDFSIHPYEDLRTILMSCLGCQL